jgi:hypothetical protein
VIWYQIVVKYLNDGTCDRECLEYEKVKMVPIKHRACLFNSWTGNKSWHSGSTFPYCNFTATQRPIITMIRGPTAILKMHVQIYVKKKKQIFIILTQFLRYWLFRIGKFVGTPNLILLSSISFLESICTLVRSS